MSSQRGAEDNVENMQTNLLICLTRVFKVKGQLTMTKVCNSKVLYYKLHRSINRAVLIKNTYDNSQKSLYSSLILFSHIFE